jgi:hypothetical protein
MQATALHTNGPPTWAFKPGLAEKPAPAVEAARTVADILLASSTKDELLDAFDDGLDSVEYGRYLHLRNSSEGGLAIKVTDVGGTDPGRVFGEYAERLDIVDGHFRTLARVWQNTKVAPDNLPRCAETVRVAVDLEFGNLAGCAVAFALARGVAIPPWQAEVLTDKLLVGVRAFLKLAALSAPEAVPTSVLSEDDRIDLTACRSSADRYKEWLQAG